MTPVDPTGIADRLAVGGTAGLIAGLVFALFAVVLGFQFRWVVQGWLYRETKTECKSWQTLAEGQGDKIERLTTLVELLQRSQDRSSEKSDRTAAVAEANAAKLDRILILFETIRKPAR